MNFGTSSPIRSVFWSEYPQLCALLSMLSLPARRSVKEVMNLVFEKEREDGRRIFKLSYEWDRRPQDEQIVRGKCKAPPCSFGEGIEV